MTTINLDELLAAPNKEVTTNDAALTVKMGTNKLALGAHRLQLTVVDDSGNSGSTVISIVVYETGAPIAVLTIKNAQGVEITDGRLLLGADFILDGAKSADTGGGKIVKYIWQLVA